MRSAALGWLLVLQLGQPLQPAAAAEGGPAAEIVEQFRRGEQAWRASCPKSTEDGGCVELRGNPHRPRLFAIARDPALVTEARRRFRTVATLWRRLGGVEIPGATQSVHPGRAPSLQTNYAEIFRVDPDLDRRASTSAVAAAPARPDATGAAHAAAGAAFYLAEARFEAFIQIIPPRDPILSRYPPDVDLIEGPLPARSRQMQRRLAAFVARKLDHLARTRQMYLTVVATREAPFDVAALARLGQLYQGFDDDLPGGQLEDHAVAAFEKCFESARYDEWFRLCEHALTALRPIDFPEAHELGPEASYAAGGIVRTPVIPRLE
ncbi:MAG TPA: hypothetical protein VGP64_15730 [Polyangia bacterium]